MTNLLAVKRNVPGGHGRWADAFGPHVSVKADGADAAVATGDVRRDPALPRGPERTFGAIKRLKILKKKTSR